MKLYLTGGSGFLGSNMIRVAREDYGWAVFTTVNAWRASSPVDFAYARIDIGDRDAVLRSVQEIQPDAIVHSAILNDFDLMYRDRALAWRLYVEATHHLADAANAAGCKIVLISTDWVFDGTHPSGDLYLAHYNTHAQGPRCRIYRGSCCALERFLPGWECGDGASTVPDPRDVMAVTSNTCVAWMRDKESRTWLLGLETRWPTGR
jgi:nucleoside-diphosphate-sugar epimerase